MSLKSGRNVTVFLRGKERGEESEFFKWKEKRKFSLSEGKEKREKKSLFIKGEEKKEEFV